MTYHSRAAAGSPTRRRRNRRTQLTTALKPITYRTAPNPTTSGATGRRAHWPKESGPPGGHGVPSSAAIARAVDASTTADQAACTRTRRGIGSPRCGQAGVPLPRLKGGRAGFGEQRLPAGHAAELEVQVDQRGEPKAGHQRPEGDRLEWERALAGKRNDGSVGHVECEQRDEQE